jgi:RNA polymerase sigma factor (TIGR02999 family)
MAAGNDTGPDGPSSEITALRAAVRSGQVQHWDSIIRELYPELRRLAHRARNPHDRLLETTAVVHEAWLRIAARPDSPIRDRAHLMALAALVMRQVVCDHARERLAQKRGCGVEPVELSAAERMADEDWTRPSVIWNRLWRAMPPCRRPTT